MRTRIIVSLIGLIGLVAAVGMVAVQPSAQAAPLTKGKAEVSLVIELGKGADGTTTPVKEILKAVSNIGSSGLDGYRVDSFFDVSYVSNIGSSGLDGYSVDSFFDITYRVGNSTDIELVALSLSGILDDPEDPEAAIEAVRKAVGGKGTVFYGHVTVLK